MFGERPEGARGANRVSVTREFVDSVKSAMKLRGVSYRDLSTMTQIPIGSLADMKRRGTMLTAYRDKIVTVLRMEEGEPAENHAIERAVAVKAEPKSHLLQLCEEIGLTLPELARKVKISLRSIKAIASEKTTPKRLTRMKIEQALGTKQVFLRV